MPHGVPHEPHSWPPLSRRGLIRTGAGASLAALGLGVGAQTASAAVATTKRFDLTQPSYDLFRSKDTHGARVQQSFAFDWVNKFLFVATKRTDSPESAGDLCINKMDFDGNYISYMHLNGFGHGVAFAALPSGSGTDLWIECAANDNGYGTALTPIRYTANTTLGSPAASAAYRPISGATEYTCSVDPVYQRMIVRYHTSAGKRIAVYPSPPSSRAASGRRWSTSSSRRSPALRRATPSTARTCTT